MQYSLHKSTVEISVTSTTDQFIVILIKSHDGPFCELNISLTFHMSIKVVQLF